MRAIVVLCVGAGAVVGVWACSGTSRVDPATGKPRAPVEQVAPGGDGTTTQGKPAAPAAGARGDSTTVAVALVTDPAALAAIDAGGGRFDALLDAADRRAITKAVKADVAAAAKGDPDAGVAIAGNSHRLFDVGWLDRGSYELVGLAYRVDRIPATPATCGDVRLIYRLAYRATTAGVEVGSRLPMTVAIVLDGPARAPAGDDALGCRAAAAAWRVPAGTSGRALGDALIAGPLAGDALAPARVRQVLTNAQVVRWPAAVRPDLGGHAEYALRAFRRDPGGALIATPADNTPDAARLRRDPKARAALLAWLREPATLDAVELGWAQLPAELAAPRALSVSPRGWARRANRLYRQVFDPADLDGIAGAARPTIATPEALLRRLDDHTCVGCHQAQTIAGFHLLGEDGAGVAPGNALAVAISAPLAAERTRREQLLDALATGAAADFHRPPTERTGNPGGRGAHCGLGDPGFASWTCAAGLTCQHTDAPADDAVVGECLPPPDRREVGDACELGPLIAHADPRRDRGPRPKPVAGGCVASTCNVDRVGFPGGMCRASCDPLPAGGACGVIAVLTPFNACLARGRPFPECLADHVEPAGLRACDAATPCRDDYVCARTPSGAGACTPPYFLFQLRVDGHPLSSKQRGAARQAP
jgi:hypothetical protein